MRPGNHDGPYGPFSEFENLADHLPLFRSENLGFVELSMRNGRIPGTVLGGSSSAPQKAKNRARSAVAQSSDPLSALNVLPGDLIERLDSDGKADGRIGK